jgi:hypothetical protein
MRSRVNTLSQVNTANLVSTLSRDNTLRRDNTANMLSRVVTIQHILCGVITGAANTPNRFTIHGPITTRLTAITVAMLLPGITAAVDITAVGTILVALVITAAEVAVIAVAVTLVAGMEDTGRFVIVQVTRGCNHEDDQSDFNRVGSSNTRWMYRSALEVAPFGAMLESWG